MVWNWDKDDIRGREEREREEKERENIWERYIQ